MRMAARKADSRTIIADRTLPALPLTPQPLCFLIPGQFVNPRKEERPMPRSRFLGPTVLAVALAVTQLQAGWSDEPKSPDKPSLFPPAPKAAAAPKATEPAKAGATCVIYPLADLGRDPGLAKWVAET